MCLDTLNWNNTVESACWWSPTNYRCWSKNGIYHDPYSGEFCMWDVFKKNTPWYSVRNLLLMPHCTGIVYKLHLYKDDSTEHPSVNTECVFYTYFIRKIYKYILYIYIKFYTHFIYTYDIIFVHHINTMLFHALNWRKKQKCNITEFKFFGLFNISF